MSAAPSRAASSLTSRTRHTAHGRCGLPRRFCVGPRRVLSLRTTGLWLRSRPRCGWLAASNPVGTLTVDIYRGLFPSCTTLSDSGYLTCTQHPVHPLPPRPCTHAPHAQCVTHATRRSCIGPCKACRCVVVNVLTSLCLYHHGDVCQASASLRRCMSEVETMCNVGQVPPPLCPSSSPRLHDRSCRLRLARQRY